MTELAEKYNKIIRAVIRDTTDARYRWRNDGYGLTDTQMFDAMVVMTDYIEQLRTQSPQSPQPRELTFNELVDRVQDHLQDYVDAVRIEQDDVVFIAMGKQFSNTACDNAEHLLNALNLVSGQEMGAD